MVTLRHNTVTTLAKMAKKLRAKSGVTRRNWTSV